MYKSKLQELCHGRQWGLPRYTAMKDGPDHNPCFKASVSVNGFSFDSPGACKSSKQAQNQAAMLAFLHYTSPPSSSSVQFEATVTADEHTFQGLEFVNTLTGADNAAPKAVSMSLPQDGSQIEEESGHYKNLLQELAQREGFFMPAYKTVRSGASHMPTFSSTVEVEGEIFCGKPGKSKKQAELSAAKVAYIALKARGLSRATELTYPHLTDGLKTTQFSDLKMTVDPLKDLLHEPQVVSSPAIKYEECELQGDNMNAIGKDSSCSELILPSVEECPSSPAVVQSNLHAVSVSITNEEKGAGVRSYLLCNRVRVYNQFPDIAFPNHVTVLPISDDKWVAFSLEFPKRDILHGC